MESAETMGAIASERRHFPANDLNARVRRDSLVHGLREQLAVDRQRAAAGDACRIGRLEDHRPHRAHFGLQQAMSVGDLGALERVGAHELSEPIGLVRRRLPHRPHLVQHDGVAALGKLVGGFGSGEAAANHVNSRQRGMRTEE